MRSNESKVLDKFSLNYFYNFWKCLIESNATFKPIYNIAQCT